MKRKRRWFPLAVDFWDDPDVIEAGDSAAILYLRLVGWSKSHATGGTVPEKVVRGFGGRAWKRKADALIEVGMLRRDRTDAAPVPHADGTCAASVPHASGTGAARRVTYEHTICAFGAWNELEDEVAELRENAAQRQRNKRSRDAGVTALQERDVTGVSRQQREKEKEKGTPVSPLTPEPPPTAFGLVLGNYARRFEEAHGVIFGTAAKHHAALLEVANQCEGQARLESVPVAEVVTRALDGLFSSKLDYVADCKHSPTCLTGTGFAKFYRPSTPVDGWREGLDALTRRMTVARTSGDADAEGRIRDEIKAHHRARPAT